MSEDLIKRFEIYQIKNEVPENTYKSYISDIKLFLKYYEDTYGIKFEKLTRQAIVDYKQYVKVHKGNKFSTINRYISALKSFNNFLIEENLQQDMIIFDKDYKKIQQDMPTSRPKLTDDEIKKLLLTASLSKKNAEREVCVLTILIYGGVRESELINIQLSHILFDIRRIQIIGKGEKYREIIINDTMYDALKTYLKIRQDQNINSDYLFVGQMTNYTKGKPLARNFVNRLVTKYKKLTGIEICYPHLLRAYFCTNAHKKGYTVKEVQVQAGHSSSRTTDGYIRYEEEGMLEKANRL